MLAVCGRSVYAYAMEKLEITPHIREKMAAALAREPVLFAYVFGSQVMGHTHAESDIDIAVYFSPDVLKEQRITKQLYLVGVFAQILKVSEDTIDVAVLNGAPLLLRYVAKNEGVVLYEQDRLVRAEYEIRLRQEFEDQLHYRQEYDQEFLKRLTQKYA